MIKLALSSAALVIAATAANSGDYTLTPNGTYLPGKTCTMAPDGSYVPGRQATLAPDGTCVGGDRATLTPNGGFVGEPPED